MGTNHGKRICATLKEVRKQIADANDIPYEITECKHQGRCPGTCPKCEFEVRYIENQLSLRRAAGKAVSIIGISLSAMNVYASTEPQPTVPVTSSDTAVEATSRKYKIRGRILSEEEKEVLPGAAIAVKGTTNGTTTNLDGEFAISVDTLPVKIVLSYVGYDTKIIDVTEKNYSDLGDLLMVEDEMVIGEVVMIEPQDALPIYEYRVSGYIRTADGKVINNAMLRYGKKKTYHTNHNGYFEFQLKSIPWDVTIEAPGYKPKTIEFNESNHEMQSTIYLEKE